MDVKKYGALAGLRSEISISIRDDSPTYAILIKSALLFNTDISLKIFANISIGRIKYMNGINKVCTTSIVNSHTDRKAVFP